MICVVESLVAFVESNANNDKNVTKKTIVSSVSVFFSIFAYTCTIVINNNIDPGGPSPLNLILATQFKWDPTIISKRPPI